MTEHPTVCGGCGYEVPSDTMLPSQCPECGESNWMDTTDYDVGASLRQDVGQSVEQDINIVTHDAPPSQGIRPVPMPMGRCPRCGYCGRMDA